MTCKLNRKCFWRAGKAKFLISGVKSKVKRYWGHKEKTKSVLAYYFLSFFFSSKVLLSSIFSSRACPFTFIVVWILFLCKTTPPAAKEEYHNSFLTTAFQHHPYYFILHDNKLKGLWSVTLYNFCFNWYVYCYVRTSVFLVDVFIDSCLTRSLAPLPLQ